MGNRFGTEKGFKCLVIAIVCALAVHLLFSLKTEKEDQRNLWKETAMAQLSSKHYAKLRPLIDPLGPVLDQNNLALADLVAKKFLIEPSKKDYALKNSDPTFDTSMGQAQVVRKILNNKVKAASSSNSSISFQMSRNVLEKRIFYRMWCI